MYDVPNVVALAEGVLGCKQTGKRVIFCERTHPYAYKNTQNKNTH